jgi:hypothetical protein
MNELLQASKTQADVVVQGILDATPYLCALSNSHFVNEKIGSLRRAFVQCVFLVRSTLIEPKPPSHFEQT